MADKAKLTEQQAWVVKLLTDSGLRHRGIVAEWGALRGYRGVSRTIDTLIQRGLITCDEDDYLTAASTAEIAAPAPVERIEDGAELHRCPPLHMELAQINGGLVTAIKLELDELKDNYAALKRQLAEARQALRDIVDYVDEKAQILDLPLGLRLRTKAAKAWLNADRALATATGEVGRE